MRRAALLALLMVAGCGQSAPEPLYELRVDYVWRGEVHTAVADYNLTYQDCRNAQPDLIDAYCVLEN